MTARTSAPRFGTLADWLICAPLIVTTFLAKLAIPYISQDPGLALLLVLLTVVIGLVTQRMQIDTRQFVAYLAMIAALGSFQLLGAREFSLPSFALMVAIYFAYALRVERDGDSGRRALHFATEVGSVIAVCGIVQFAAQFVLPYNFVFPIETMVPPELLIDGYNTQIPLYFGAKIYKSNGFFCLEPSFFSQLLAISIVVELVTRNRLSRLALMACGIAVSYSGTGLIVLMFCIPTLIIARRRWDLIALGLLCLGGAMLLSDKLSLDVFLQRAGEFSERRSSGFERFVGGFYLFDQYLWSEPLNALTGHGAGTFLRFARRANEFAAEMAFFKIVFEFGIIGAILNFGFLFYAVLRSSGPPVVKLAVVVAYFMNGIYTPTSHGFALTLLIWPTTRPTTNEGAIRGRSRPVREQGVATGSRV